MAWSSALQAVRTREDAVKLPWGARAQLATAAAWSPNPNNPPLYLDLPIKDGVVQNDVVARWAANAPLALIDQYVGNLRRYRGIAIDVGDQDGLRADAARLHEALDRYGIGFYYTNLSNNLQEIILSGSEIGLEIFYNFAATHWLYVTPDIQVIEPAGKRATTAFLTGLRVQMKF